MSLSVGVKAPAIKSPDFSLSALKGKTVVVFFYPKSDTPGCTQESCDFRDLRPKFTKKNAEIVGVSPDKAEALIATLGNYDLIVRTLISIE